MPRSSFLDRPALSRRALLRGRRRLDRARSLASALLPSLVALRLNPWIRFRVFEEEPRSLRLLPRFKLQNPRVYLFLNVIGKSGHLLEASNCLRVSSGLG